MSPDARAVHALILTYNEALHIRRCIESVTPWCATILVVDSESTDATRAIAAELGAQVLIRPFRTHAGQVNAGIDHLASRGGWILRIDADEVLEPPPTPLAVATAGYDALLVRRHIVWAGRRIRFGGLEPNWQLRLWRNGAGRCEQRWMDEHVVVAGVTGKSAIELTDINLNPVGWWIAKHDNYASREAIEMLDRRHGVLARTPDAVRGDRLHGAARIKRWIKNRLYARLPGGVRSGTYFLYRYVLRLGFLDGRQGWYFHFLQAWWYRTLVDCKIDAIETWRCANGGDWPDAIAAVTGIDIRTNRANPDDDATA